MPWVPCNRCFQAPCQCRFDRYPWVPLQPGTTTPFVPWPEAPSIPKRLSEEEIERIARRVAELLKLDRAEQPDQPQTKPPVKRKR